MRRHGRRAWTLAACLSALAGYVDAIGFLEIDGFFVSFMSGNSTRLAVGLARHTPAVPIAAGLIACFVGGVVVATLAGRRAGDARQPAVLFGVGLVLALVALAGSGLSGACLMACAMGGMNTMFERDGEVSIGVTYMTGTLVKLGQRLADALDGGARWAWLPYLLLWSGLLGGATVGAIVQPRFGLTGLWLAAAGALGLGALCWIDGRRRAPGGQ